ncbi:type I polyketide synthase [Streptomyces nojiriensis]|uniref:type I polyketide synthase n=1 Tax=Streptomyces nojiriensis TaxID=66374 RepID=UPI0036AB3AFD
MTYRSSSAEQAGHGRATEHTVDVPPHAIAVIGMSGRFPGAAGIREFWGLLRDGRDGVTDAPPDRPWLRDLYSPTPGAPGRLPTRRGGFLEGLDRFDAGFFEISPREARRVDPQQRLLLEVSHEAAEDAGTPVRELSRARTGVFIGAFSGDYWLRQIGDLEALDLYGLQGGIASSLHGRIAYALNLRGPALTVDTACSSSLVSIHVACQSLRLGECDLALAGGSHVVLAPYASLALARAGALGADGRCRFGDAAAAGYVQSEAVGMLLLKPLARALAEGDRVRAVILGGAVGSSGFTGQGMIAPTVVSQESVLRAAYRAAGVDPREVAFVEAHGPGTPAGDPVELNALSRVLGPREGRRPCLVSSAKTSVGHTEGAAGVVAVIRAVLCLEHRTVPGNSGLSEPNPAVDWDGAPILLPRRAVSLSESGHPLLAGVTSFGASGTGVHLVLSSAPASRPAHPSQPGRPSQPAKGGADGPAILPVSARSAAALTALAERYADLLDSGDAPPLAELCAAAATRRDHHEYRLALTARTHSSLAEGLRAHLAGEERPGVAASASGCWSPPRIVFVFPGQGSQWAGMGRKLLARESAFTNTLERCDAVIRAHGGWSLCDALNSEDDTWLRRTSRIQPALWAMGVSLAELWRSWGIEPDAVLGHSQGEIAAAQVAGALTLEEAGHISCLRARLIDELALPGALCWVQLARTEIPSLLGELNATAEIAVEESATSTVLAGTPAEIRNIVEGCERRGVSCLPVPVAYAAHSPSVDPVRTPLLDGLDTLVPRPTTVPFLSTVTASVLPGTALDRAYWWRNLREPVLLEPVVRSQLTGGGKTVFLQASPHPVLTNALRGDGAVVLGSLRRDHPELSTLYASLATLYATGCDPAWSQVLGSPRGHVELPGYPWQRSRHWHQAASFPWPPIGTAPTEEPAMDDTAAPEDSGTAHPLLGPEEPASGAGRRWRGPLDRDRHAFLLDHRVSGRPVVPAAAFLELALATAGQAGELRDVELRELLLLDDEEAWDLDLRVSVEGDGGDAPRMEVASRRGRSTHWTTHATMTLTDTLTGVAPTPVALDALRGRCPDWQAGERFYRDRALEGNDWRGAFRCMAEILRGDGESVVRLRSVPAAGYRIHPGLLDGYLQAALTTAETAGSSGRGFVLLGVGRLRVHRAPDGGELWVHARRRSPASANEVRVDLTVLDGEGSVIAEIDGVRGRSLDPAHRDHSAAQAAPTAARMLDLRWRPLPAPTAPAAGGNWLLVASGTPLDRTLCAELTEKGHTVSTVSAAARYGTEGPGRYRADLTSAGDLTRVLTEASRSGPLTGIVHLAPLGCATTPDASPREVQWTATDLCTGLLPLARALRELRLSPTPQMFVLTRGAQAVLDEDRVPAPWQAPLWALAQTLRLEVPQCATVLVDLDAHQHDPERDAVTLAAHLLSGTAEDRIALRGEHGYAPRLVATDERASPRGDVRLYTTGGIAGISMKPLAERVEPGPGEIAVEVSHVGINYRDVLSVVGMLDGHDAELVGCECSGTVVRLGAGVTNVKVGDHVLTYTFSPPSSYTVTPAVCAVVRPEQISPAEAAAIPVAHASAYRGVVEMARIRPGETVLIHSATGGMGMAAMEIARWRGATVYATAGTEAKRDLLLKMGAAKVADSRTTDFARSLRGPEGKGVDVILNTLAGAEAMEANLALLSPSGRYVDAACNEMYSGRPVPLSLFLPARSYHAMDLAALHQHEPESLRVTLTEITGLLARGEVAPPRIQVFPAQRASEAMTLMARAEHIGKLVLKFDADNTTAKSRAAVRPDATYLVVGGLSGIGGLVTDWLVASGARHLLLTGRSRISADDPTEDPRAGRLSRLMRQTDTEVQYEAVDVADEAAMAALLRGREERGLPEVAGVVHSALTLEPSPLTDMSETEVDRTLRPKVAGGWTLHRLFPDDSLDFFVLFSSAVSWLSGLRLGSQLGAYAAGNAFLDALAVHRRAAGLPATVVNWGYWAGTGMAHRLGERDGRSVRPAGVLPVRPEDAPELFEAMLSANGAMFCFPADWPAYAAAAPRDANAPILRELIHPGRVPDPKTPTRTDGPPHTAAFTDASAAHPPTRSPNSTSVPAEPARAARPAVPVAPARPTPSAPAPAAAPELEKWLIEQVARVLDMPAAEIDPTRPVNRLGIDSLLAAELGTQLRRAHGLETTVPRIVKSPSLRALATDLTSPTPGGAA